METVKCWPWYEREELHRLKSIVHYIAVFYGTFLRACWGVLRGGAVQESILGAVSFSSDSRGDTKERAARPKRRLLPLWPLFLFGEKSLVASPATCRKSASHLSREQDRFQGIWFPAPDTLGEPCSPFPRCRAIPNPQRSESDWPHWGVVV